jgi:hypothetical protein
MERLPVHDLLQAIGGCYPLAAGVSQVLESPSSWLERCRPEMASGGIYEYEPKDARKRTEGGWCVYPTIRAFIGERSCLQAEASPDMCAGLAVRMNGSIGCKSAPVDIEVMSSDSRHPKEGVGILRGTECRDPGYREPVPSICARGGPEAPQKKCNNARIAKKGAI